MTPAQEIRNQAMAEGERRGRKTCIMAAVRCVLLHRLGYLPEQVEDQLQGAAAERIEAWHKALVAGANYEEVFGFGRSRRPVPGSAWSAAR